jgi:transposase
MRDEEIGAKLTGENARQREQSAALVEQNAALAAQVQELRARLAKDSPNSSKPPSSDGVGRQPKSLRRRSGKQAGGQLGHRGQAPLDEAAVLLRERRQVPDLPRVRRTVPDHQARHVRCAACQVVAVGAFPAEVTSRAEYGPRRRACAV